MKSWGRWGAGVWLAIAWLTSLAAADAPPPGEPFLWLIEGQKPSFLFGTIHLPDPRVLAFPDVVVAASTGCDELCTEVPMTIDSALALNAAGMCAPNQSLSQWIPADLFQHLDRYLRQHHPPFTAEKFDRTKPWAVAVTLQVLPLMKRYRGGVPQDLALSQRAKAAGKALGAIETPEEQIGVFDTLAADEQVALLKGTIEELEQAEKDHRDAVDETLAWYLKGEETGFAALLGYWMKDQDPLSAKLRDALLTKRNERMANRIAARTKEQPGRSFFIALGAAHYFGDDGILHRLAAKGLRVVRLTRADDAKVRKLLGLDAAPQPAPEPVPAK